MSTWNEENNKLSKSFKFDDFTSAFAFMTKMALYAEQCNHHPNWSNVYNQVNIELTTHSAGNTITDKDRNFAKKADEAYRIFAS